MDIFFLYFYFVKIWFKSRIEYQMSFFAGFFANFYCYFITYAILWVIIKKFNSIGGWNFSELTILYSFNLLSYAISGTLFWYSIYHLEDLVVSGNFDRYLLRPLGIIPQLMCTSFGYTFLGQILVSSIFLISNFYKVADLTFFNIFYLCISLIGSVFLQAGAVILVGSLSFWILRSKEVGAVVYYQIRNFINYPLNIYPSFLKIILTFIIPWGFINYYPCLIFLNKYNNLYDHILGLIAPLVCIIIFIISLKVFSIGLRQYSSTGS